MQKIQKNTIVYSKSVNHYDEDEIYSKLPDDLFSCIRRNSSVTLKPNWVLESHQYRKGEWEYVITHPTLISAVIRKVVERLESGGQIIIADAPTTEASYDLLISKYPVRRWADIAAKKGVSIQIIDLRDNKWKSQNGIIVDRINLKGDPRGKTEVDLSEKLSEFYGHKKSRRGYYGADYDTSETNNAHNGRTNLYRVSRSVIESDVFINLPKLKTHRKAGITCCLKNLVGINTYKNFLPHHSEGSPKDGGDQFPTDKSINARVEGPLMAYLKKHVLPKQSLARFLSPLSNVGKKLFGDTRDVIRSGNWYGNDTIWRMLLDLNKILLFAKPNGNMREDVYTNRKHYIGIVDAILAGEGDGPLAPEPVQMNLLIFGNNPVAIDTVSAWLMGFDPFKIPSIKNAFYIQHYKICDFSFQDIEADLDGQIYNLTEIPDKFNFKFKPHFGWENYLERSA